MYLVNLIPLNFCYKILAHLEGNTPTDKGESAEGAIIALSFWLPPPPPCL